MAGGKKGGGGGGASKKTQTKQNQKIIEDKTFGLKNKNKSQKVQKYVTQVKKQVENGNTKRRDDFGLPKVVDPDIEALLLNKPVVVQKQVEKGEDPKSVLCEFFKQGNCRRGKNCKYSHDMAVERKSTKIDLYTDRRGEEEDDMANWDQNKLESVVEKKHQSTNTNKTAIVCKHFIDAVEKKKYGWFWECPNGGVNCPYRHALPPGFVFKSEKKKDNPEDEIPIEERIEEERARLTTNTPVTLERFLEWREKKRKLKEIAENEARIKRKEDIKSGKVSMSGREMFVANPDLFVDDEEAGGEDDYQLDENYDPTIPVNIVNVTATSLTLTAVSVENEDDDDEEKKEDGAEDQNIDSSLFTGDDFEEDIPDE